jgi:hypothetical protein
MSIKQINSRIINLGTRLMASIKYEIDSKYSVFEFFKLRTDKADAIEKKLRKFLNNQ